MSSKSSNPTLLRRSLRIANHGIRSPHTPVVASNSAPVITTPLRRSLRLARKSNTPTIVRECVSLSHYLDQMELLLQQHEALAKLRGRAGMLMRMRSIADIFTMMKINHRFCSMGQRAEAEYVSRVVSAGMYASRFRDDPKFKAAASELQAIFANFA